MNGNRQPHPEIATRDVVLAVFRHRKKATAFFLFVMTATAAVTFLTPKAYMSKSKLFVRLGRENAMLDSAATLGNNPVVAVPSSRESEINSVAEMLASRAILEQVVDELGPETILDDRTQEMSEQSAREGGVARWLQETGNQARNWGSGVVASLRSAVSTSSLTPRDQALELLVKKLTAEPVRNRTSSSSVTRLGSPNLPNRSLRQRSTRISSSMSV